MGVTAWRVQFYRVLLTCAAWFVPKKSRSAWQEDWQGDFWRWTLAAALQGDAEAQIVLRTHTRDAIKAAWSVSKTVLIDSPWIPIVTGAVMFAFVATISHGFEGVRKPWNGLSYRDPAQLVLLSQGPPTLGVRLGFLQREVEELRQKSHGVESLSTYSWFKTNLVGQETLAAAVGPEFFDVLGLRTELGQWTPSERSFVVGHEYFLSDFGGDKSALGRQYLVDGSLLTLTGVLPPKFSFLGLPIAVWIPSSVHAGSDPGQQWWLGLRGTVARLKGGTANASVEEELRSVLVAAGLGRKNSKVFVTPVETATNRHFTGYSALLAALLVGWIGWTLFAGYKTGEPKRFWAYFLAKSLLPVASVFLFVFEVLANRAGSTTRAWWGKDLFALWILFCFVALIAAWAWRDQKQRCRTCLCRLRQPLRIGTWGQVLLDPSGEEIVCPRGHGSLFTSTSLAGQDLSGHWIDLDPKSLN